MNTSAIKKALYYTAGWGMVLFFFGLLTLIFSFLGSFFCAGLAGMMVGSVKFSRLQTAALSLTAPAVLYGILRFGHTELLAGQIFLLAGLSFGIFWLTYIVVRLVVFYEHKTPPAPAGARNTVASSVNGEQKLKTYPQSTELSLPVLQGNWSCAANNGKMTREQKRMVIANEKLVLTVSDASGNVSFLGEGHVSLNNHQGQHRLMISRLILDSPADTLVSI